jgi:predicted N-acetyltransferase YhbS
MARVTAVFDDQAQAELAVTELRRLGVTDTDLSFVARSEEEAVVAGLAGQRGQTSG